MTDILGDQLALLAPTVDVPAGHAQLRRRIVARRRRQRWLAGSLAIGTGAVVVAGLYALTLRDPPDARLNSIPPPPTETTVETTAVETMSIETTAIETTTTVAPLPGYTVIGTSDENISTLGSLDAAGNDTQLAEMWSRSNMPEPTPVVDFSDHIVLAMTIADSGCPDVLVAMNHTEPNTFTPVFEEQQATPSDSPTACSEALVGRTFIVTAEKSVVGEQFTLRLPEAEGHYRDSHVDVVVTPDEIGLLPPDRTTVSQAAEWQEAAEQAIRSESVAGTEVLCDLPASTDVGTRFDCTRTTPDGMTDQLVAEVTAPNRVDVHDVEPSSSTTP